MSIAYYNKTVQEVAEEIVAEASRASALFPPMNSPHEAAAVIREEFDEYWDEVKKHNTSKPDRDTRPRQREELIQLAAMCIRAITDTIDIKTPRDLGQVLKLLKGTHDEIYFYK